MSRFHSTIPVFHSTIPVFHSVVLAFTTLVIACDPAWADDESEISFNRDIRPILSDKCYFCHGPDANDRKADLRFDVREAALEAFESGDFLHRITTVSPDDLMPPPDSNLTLTVSEKDLLERWVEQGAKYEAHWAFTLLPDEVPVPVASKDEWSRQTLDQFVLDRIKNAGQEPTAEATPLRWLRRTYLDLVGLPPTPDAIARFEKELVVDAEAAREAAVDRLLASSGFGEHLAVRWLDLARYADSYGYQSDKLNTQWPYRDWVVKAFNDNLPYDDFLIWQLAGDLLENPTSEQILATAFNRIHRLNNEGGAVFKEWRIENVADRVHTFGTAFLGLTMECCRCHDHKYDPIPASDYYSLSAFFNSIDESGVYDRHEKVPCPSLLLPTDAQSKTLAEAKRKLAVAETRYADVMAKARAGWNGDESAEISTIPDLELALGFDREFDESHKKIYHPSELDRKWTTMVPLVPVNDSPIPSLDDSSNRPTDSVRLAMQLDGERGVTTHGVFPFDRWTPFTVVISLQETKRSPLRGVIAHHTRGTDCGYNGWDLTIVDGHLESRLARVWPGNAIGVRTKDPIDEKQWVQVSASYDGSSRARGLRIFVNGEELEIEVLRDEIKKSANVEVQHGGEFVVGQRFRARGFTGGLIDDVRIFSRNLSLPEVEWLATGNANVSADWFASAKDPDAREAFAALNVARHAAVMAEEVIQEVPVMREDAEPRVTHLLARGVYDAPTSDDTRVERDTLSALPLPFPEDQPRDRLGLARWVTHPQHPLTARVAVNHLWSVFFADALVRTPENFGLQGELPTHPQLLNWLARDFIKSDWDVKRFCRNVVLSATYRQDSNASPRLIAADPENRLLARTTPYRVTAEQIRDLALGTSGLLNPEPGGPPVSPYQPGEDLWRQSNGMSPPYQQSVGKALYRRSLYSVWKRTSPLPNMMAFDTTTREVCTVERSRTNTPMQALVLLNDVQFVETARALAETILKDGASDAEQIERAFLTLAGRRPDATEAQLLQELLADEREHFQSHPEDARSLIAHGESEIDAELPVANLAALTAVCQAIFNLDATVWKR